MKQDKGCVRATLLLRLGDGGPDVHADMPRVVETTESTGTSQKVNFARRRAI